MGIYEELEWRGLIKDVSDPSLREKSMGNGLVSEVQAARGRTLKQISALSHQVLLVNNKISRVICLLRCFHFIGTVVYFAYMGVLVDHVVLAQYLNGNGFFFS